MLSFMITIRLLLKFVKFEHADTRFQRMKCCEANSNEFYGLGTATSIIKKLVLLRDPRPHSVT
eukprot:m.822564 g.822564  ORF g.822564 m.822564 type:complete len:63 (+) comp23402_c0_seq73:2827-3015(+)